MDQDEVIAQGYMDGTFAAEIEHFLFLRLHPLNTIEEIEALKELIYKQMMDMFNLAQARGENELVFSAISPSIEGSEG